MLYQFPEFLVFNLTAISSSFQGKTGLQPGGLSPPRDFCPFKHLLLVAGLKRNPKHVQAVAFQKAKRRHAPLKFYKHRKQSAPKYVQEVHSTLMASLATLNFFLATGMAVFTGSSIKPYCSAEYSRLQHGSSLSETTRQTHLNLH